jgi:hypothetical protein
MWSTADTTAGTPVSNKSDLGRWLHSLMLLVTPQRRNQFAQRTPRGLVPPNGGHGGKASARRLLFITAGVI